ncbi:hypothetical protein GCM10008967_14910 [Bacillus carboniphilus]|uniref:Membrane protein YizD n=1 Tax=Bacillus carboniphilus TaxID=86663 RepID=A0ABP3FW83_9BACI
MLARIPIIIMTVIFIIAFVLQLLGMLKVVPLYISSPILFISIFLLISYWNERKRFRGYH